MRLPEQKTNVPTDFKIKFKFELDVFLELGLLITRLLIRIPLLGYLTWSAIKNYKNLNCQIVYNQIMVRIDEHCACMNYRNTASCLTWRALLFIIKFDWTGLISFESSVFLHIPRKAFMFTIMSNSLSQAAGESRRRRCKTLSIIGCHSLIVCRICATRRALSQF